MINYVTKSKETKSEIDKQFLKYCRVPRTHFGLKTTIKKQI